VENPDNLRLLDTTLPQQEPAVLDIELFPTDNANINGTGSIAFGPDKVFALDSNNGIMALNIGNLECRPDQLSLTRTRDSVRITWTRPNYRLLGAPAMLGAATQWDVIQPDVGLTGVATVPVGSGNRFFKLVCP
jgi:hypothetical protein